MDTKKSVLIADDDTEIVDTYKKFVEKAGLIPLVAINGEETITMCDEHRPAVLVLDVDMPKRDGLTVLEELRKTPWGKELPIIILTGKEPDQSRIERMAQWSPTYYFVKGEQSSDEFISVLQNLAQFGAVQDGIIEVKETHITI